MICRKRILETFRRNSATDKNERKRRKDTFSLVFFVCLMPDGFLAGYPFAPAACPGFDKACGVGDFLFLTQTLEIRKICPGVGDDSDKRQIQRTQQKRLDGMPVFVYADFFRIGLHGFGCKDEKSKAYAAFAFPMRFDTGPISFMRAAQIFKIQNQTQQSLRKPPCQLEEDVGNAFDHSDDSFICSCFHYSTSPLHASREAKGELFFIFDIGLTLYAFKAIMKIMEKEMHMGTTGG